MQREAIPNPGQPGPPAEVPHPAQGRQPRPLRRRLPVGRRGGRSRSASGPQGLYLVERREYGPLIGTPVRVARRRPGGGERTRRRLAALPGLVRRGASATGGRLKALEKSEIGAVNYAIEQIRLAAPEAGLPREAGRGRRPLRGAPGARRARRRSMKARYAGLEEKLAKRMEGAGAARVVFRTADGQEKELRALDIVPGLSRERPLLAGPRRASTRAASGSSSPTTRASRTPRAASSRPSSAP